MEKEAIAGYYNEYTDQQQKIGLNLRHYSIFRECRRNGLQSNHTVLEVGCGIGTLTSLLFPFLKSSGTLYAADISPESVRIAQKNLGIHPNLHMVVTDMSDYSAPVKFDLIILPDVLEHIPIGAHKQLFRTLSKHMHESSKIFINIPHPSLIEYYHKHSPEVLQIIDQSIFPDIMTANLEGSGLWMPVYKEYMLFHKNLDYVQILLEKQQPRTKIVHRPKLDIIRRKTWLRIYYMLSKLGIV